MPSRSLLLTALDTSGETCRGWTGEQMLHQKLARHCEGRRSEQCDLSCASGPCAPQGWTSYSCRTVWITAEWQRLVTYTVKRNVFTCRFCVLDWRRVCCLVVWKGAHHHYSLQLHQTGERPALPRADEREGGHPVVHRAGEVSGQHSRCCFWQLHCERVQCDASQLTCWRHRHSLGLLSHCAQKLKIYHLQPVGLLPSAGFLVSPSTTLTCPTWVAAPGRSSWAGLGASPSSGICSLRSKTTLPVNKKKAAITSKHTHTSFFIKNRQQPAVSSPPSDILEGKWPVWQNVSVAGKRFEMLPGFCLRST